MASRKVLSSHPPVAKVKAYRQSRGRGFFTDVFIYSQCHESVPAHRAVLSSYSPWLAGLFESFECACHNENCGQHETRVVYLIIPEVDIALLDRLMDFLYLGWMTVKSKDDYGQMSELAQSLGIHKFPHLPEDAFPQEDEEIIELIDLEREEEEEEDDHEEVEEEEEEEESSAEELYDPKDDSLEDSDQPPSVTESENEDLMDQASDPCSSPVSSWVSENPLLSQDPLSQPDNSELDSYLPNEPEIDPDFSEPSAVCVHCYQVFSEPADLVDHLSKDHPESVPEVEMADQDNQPLDISTNLLEVQNESTFARIRILPVDNLKDSKPEKNPEMVEKNTKAHLIQPSDPPEQDLKTREPFSPSKTFQDSKSSKNETVDKPTDPSASPKKIALETPESLECVTSLQSNQSYPTTEVTKAIQEPSEDVDKHGQSFEIPQQPESEMVSCEISHLKFSEKLANAQISKNEHVLQDESAEQTLVESNIELKYAQISKGDQVLQDESTKETLKESNIGTSFIQCGDGYAREEATTSNLNLQVEDGPQILLLQSESSEQIQTFVEDTSSNPKIKLDIIDGLTTEEIQIQPSNEKTELINPELKFGTPEEVQIQPLNEQTEVIKLEVKSEPPDEEQIVPLKQENIPEMSSSQSDLKEVKKVRQSGTLAKRGRSRKRTYVPRKSKAINEEAPPKIDKKTPKRKSDVVSTDGLSELDFSDQGSSSTPRSKRYSRFQSKSEEQECAPILEKSASRGRGRSRASRKSRETSTEKPSFGLDHQPLNFLDGKARDVYVQSTQDEEVTFPKLQASENSSSEGVPQGTVLAPSSHNNSLLKEPATSNFRYPLRSKRKLSPLPMSPPKVKRARGQRKAKTGQI